MSVALEIERLVREYPDVVVADVEPDVLFEIADRYLRREHNALYQDPPREYTPSEAEAAIEQIAHNRDATRERVQARQVEQRSRGEVRQIERMSREEARAAEEARRARVRSSMAAMVQALKPELVVWADLMSTTFAPRPGQTVTWADATIEQHEARAAWLEQHATSRIESASIHRKAIDELRAAGVTRLRDMVQEES